MDAQGKERYVTEIARLFPPQGKWTEEDYFSLPETNRRVELAKGMLIMAAAPTTSHQKSVMRLSAPLEQFGEENQLGEVFVAPVDVRLWRDLIRQPDVAFVRAEHLSRIHEQYIDGAPDWVAEVISPGTRKTDEQDKLAEYAQAGIPEYWLVDPEAKTIRVYVLGGEGVYGLAGAYSAEQLAKSETITGFMVEVSKIV